MIEGSLYTFLSTIGEVTDIVGDRIFPQHADEPVYPCLIYSLVTQSHDHIVTGSAGTARARVQLDCWSYSLADCSIAIEAIRQHLQGFQGLLGTIEVVGSHLNNELDLSEKPTDGSNRWLYRKTGDYTIRYRVPIPTFAKHFSFAASGGLTIDGSAPAIVA